MKILLKCLGIFLARVLDVSIGSIRTIFLVKGKNLLSCVLAFIEILIWYYVAKDVLINNPKIYVVLSYSLGYACGTYIGGLVNKYLVRSNLTLFVVCHSSENDIVRLMKSNGFGVTVIGKFDNKLTCLVELKKKNLKRFKDLLSDKKCFIVVLESTSTVGGYIV